MARMTCTCTDNYQFLAQYNRWFNERLYEVCGAMDDSERRRDRGAFFGSVHGTLNHLVWADTLWLQRFAAQDVPFAALDGRLLDLPLGATYDSMLEAGWDALRVRRGKLDDAIERWTQQMPADFPARTMRYANTKGVLREHPMWKGLTHFFNHQAHHRGQVTTLLAQAGVDVGLTDAIALV